MATTDSFAAATKSPKELGLDMLAELQKTPESCDYTLLRALIARGASAEVYNTSGEWPLQACICYGHDDIALLLVEKGADPDFRAPASPNSPLYLAAHNARVEIVKGLLDKGAALDTRSEHGDTALQEAQRRQADDERKIQQYPALCAVTKPNPYRTVVKYKEIAGLIESAAVSRAEAILAEANRLQAEADWRDEGLPLQKPITVSRQTIRLKS